MINKLIGILAIVLLGALIFFVSSSPWEQKNPGKIKIGVPDDSGGIIIHYMINVKGSKIASIRHNFKAYPVKDCCCSKSEWALSGNLLDIAILCPDAAKRLVEKDKRFEIVSPCLANSDILVVKPGVKPKKIAFSQNRFYQKHIVKSKFESGCAAVPVLSAAIPYVYTENKVDGVIVDALTGFLLNGNKMTVADDGKDRVTYVLVVRKSFKNDSLYKRFIGWFSQSVRELSQPKVLQAEIDRYKQIKLTRKEMDKWSRLKVRFMFKMPEVIGPE